MNFFRVAAEPVSEKKKLGAKPPDPQIPAGLFVTFAKIDGLRVVRGVKSIHESRPAASVGYFREI